jgi:hypothetical protein
MSRNRIHVRNLNVGLVRHMTSTRQYRWILNTYSMCLDPFSMTPRRALEAIVNELQRQYERWQSKARYKSSLDPTQDDIKKLCFNLRRSARVR